MPLHKAGTIEAVVSEIPKCGIHTRLLEGTGREAPDAYADCVVPGLGTWANVCRRCYISYGCGLGTGRGQRLVLAQAKA